MKQDFAYRDILGRARPVSAKRRPMPRLDRAAQFAPFAALSGYEDAVRESGRLTDGVPEADEQRSRLLDRQLRRLAARAGEHPRITITYFRPDEKKSGGAYVRVTGNLKRIDEAERLLILEDGTRSRIDRLCSLTFV